MSTLQLDSLQGFGGVFNGKPNTPTPVKDVNEFKNRLETLKNSDIDPKALNDLKKVIEKINALKNSQSNESENDTVSTSRSESPTPNHLQQQVTNIEDPNSNPNQDNQSRKPLSSKSLEKILNNHQRYPNFNNYYTGKNNYASPQRPKSIQTSSENTSAVEKIINKLGEIQDIKPVSPSGRVEIVNKNQIIENHTLKIDDLPSMKNSNSLESSELTDTKNYRNTDYNLLEKLDQPVIDELAKAELLEKMESEPVMDHSSMDHSNMNMNDMTSPSGVDIIDLTTVDHAAMGHDMSGMNKDEITVPPIRNAMDMGHDMNAMPDMANMNHGSGGGHGANFYLDQSRTPLLFENWHPKTTAGMTGACIAVIFMTMFWVFLMSLKQSLAKKFPTNYNKDRSRMQDPSHWGHAFMAMVVVGWGYMIMLIAMTYNGWFFMSIMVGVFLGYLLFGNSNDEVNSNFESKEGFTGCH